MRRDTSLRLIEGVPTPGGVYGFGLYGSGIYGQTESPALIPSYRMVAIPLDQIASDIS
jgi:hypothetical protein